MLDNIQIANACAIQCERQHLGLDRVACLINGYIYACGMASDSRLPSTRDIHVMAGIIEPNTDGKYRAFPVVFDNGRKGTTPHLIPHAMKRMVAQFYKTIDADEWVRAFLSLHPFSDGNGRTAFVLYNWIRSTLENPAPLPDFDW